MGFLVLVTLWLGAYAITRFGMGIREGWALLPLTICLALSLCALTLNGLLRQGVSWGVAALGTVALTATLGVASLRWPAQEFRAHSPLSRSQCWLVGLLAGAVWIATCANQQNLVDDDYWMHTATQAQILAGKLPPCNPFFPDLELQGHYGRDLLIAGLARATGVMTFRAQWIFTSLCCSLGVWLYFVLAYYASGSLPQSWMLVLLIEFGVNVSTKSGLAEYFQNNTGIVYLLLGYLMFLALHLWRHPSLRLWPLLGLMGGGYAQIYETHFGLFWLALAATLCVSQPPRQVWVAFLKAFALAVVIAVTQGGPFTDLLWRPSPPSWGPSSTRFLAGPSTQVSRENQSQQVSLRFPKAKLFQLRIGENEIQPLSCAYRYVRISNPLRSVPREDPTYTPIWSWTVLRMHWLPLYLAPLTLALLFYQRRSSQLGWLFWFVGAGAYLTPAVVDFGPVHEFEYFRWEFAAGLGFAGALGWTIADSRLWNFRAFRSRPARLLGLPLLILSLPTGLERFSAALAIARRDGLVQTTSLHTTVFSWFLRHQQDLRLDPADLEGFSTLIRESSPGQSIFVDFDPKDAFGIQFESTIVGLTGLVPRGHILPDPEAIVGLPPTSMSPTAMSFLREPSEIGLRSLKVQWLYLRARPDALIWDRLATLPQVEERLRQVRADGRQLRLYRCHE